MCVMVYNFSMHQDIPTSHNAKTITFREFHRLSIAKVGALCKSSLLWVVWLFLLIMGYNLLAAFLFDAAIYQWFGQVPYTALVVTGNALYAVFSYLFIGKIISRLLSQEKGEPWYQFFRERGVAFVGTHWFSTILVSFGHSFLFLPGLLFSYWFLLSDPIVVAEKKSWVMALLFSRDLMRGSGKRLFVMNIPQLLISSLILWTPQFFAIMVVFDRTSLLNPFARPFFILSSLLTTLLTIWACACRVTTYQLLTKEQAPESKQTTKKSLFSKVQRVLLGIVLTLLLLVIGMSRSQALQPSRVVQDIKASLSQHPQLPSEN